MSENKTILDRVLRRPKDRLTYEYDFGDSWMHDVLLEKVLLPSHEGLYPIVLAGKRACPPEDVGGTTGYVQFLEIIEDRTHPEHAEMLEWAGGRFDPETYDVGRANLDLHGGWARDDRNA